nr:integrator complex subunit 4 [Hymenolepis microstoma]
MESELWNLLSELVTRTLGHSVNSQLERVRSKIPESSLQLQTIVAQVDSLLHHLEGRYRQRILTRILSSISVGIEHIWHFSASCLRVCYDGEDSSECIATACRVALQQSWYTDTGSPGSDLGSDLLMSGSSIRPVIYLSPAAPAHLRRWLSLNLCCSGLLITALPPDENSLLPAISLPHFEKTIQNDLRQGRRPLLLVAYAGSTPTGSVDHLPQLTHICQRHKIWLHVEGLSFLRMALLPSPPVKASAVAGINSINLELSLCFGLPRSLNVLLIQSSMPESILLYLNVFPFTAATTAEDSESDTSSLFSIPRSLPSSGFKDALFAWFALRTHDGSHVKRLQHADHLITYTLQKMKSLQSIEILSNHNSPVKPTDGEIESDEHFIKLLYENSLHCPIVLFRYILPAAQEVKPPARKSLSVMNPSASADAKIKKRFMSESSVNSSTKIPSQVVDLRYLNSLNHWLASALQFEHPGFSIKTHILPRGMVVLRFSLLDSLNIAEITDQDIDKLIENINFNCTIMEATWREKTDFFKLVNSTPGMYYYNLPDWAGLGAAFYVPHAYRCLLPDANDLSPEEYQTHLISALLRLPLKAAFHICDLNRELISCLRNHDYAFSSAQVRFDGFTGMNDAIESLASRSSTGDSVGIEKKSDVEGENKVAPICQAQLHCLRFGLITPGTDTSEMVQLVLRMANTVEEDSNYVNNLSEVVRRGIEEATMYMNEERTKIIREQGILRQLPYLDRLVNWWSPPIDTQIHGRALNLSIGQLVTTDKIFPKSSPSPSQRGSISSGNTTSAFDEEKPLTSSPEPQQALSSSSSIWSWFLPSSDETSTVTTESDRTSIEMNDTLSVKCGVDSGLAVDVCELYSNNPSIQAAALCKISKTMSSGAPLGSSTAADLMLSFCCQGDCRVRATAISCLSDWAKYDPAKSTAITDIEKFNWISNHWLQVYTLACKILTEDNAKVRQVSLKSIHSLSLRFGQKEFSPDTVNPLESASLDSQFYSNRAHPSWRKPVKLIDDAFSRICDRFQDGSRFVRVSAAELIADLAELVSDDTLMLTLEKTVMSDWKVKRYCERTAAKGMMDKISQLNTLPNSSKGRRPGGQKRSNDVDSIPLLATGIPGAFICGLEDEFHEVRCAMLKTITRIAARNTLFASLCQDILVDMLTDDIQAVRLLAIESLQVVGDQVPILTDQMSIVTSALAEDCAVVRRRLHDLLSRCRLGSPPCLLILLDGLIMNMRMYREDRDSIWNCAASVGRRHPVFVELSATSLLKTHPFYGEEIPFKEDPIYITVALIVLNAYPAKPDMASQFPQHLISSQIYLREMMPHLLPKEKLPLPCVGRLSADSYLPIKKPRIEDDGETADAQFLRFLTSTVEMLRRLTMECTESLPAPRIASLKLPKVEYMEVDENRGADLHSRNCVNRLKSIINEELRICQQTSEDNACLGNLPHFLSCLLKAVLALLSASLPDDKMDSLCAADAVVATPDQRGIQVQQALRLTIKAEHMFLGLTTNEVSTIHALRSAAHRLQASSFHDTEVVRRAVTEVVYVFLNTDGIVSAAERICKPQAQLLCPPPISSETNSTTMSEKKTEAIPEIRFTAFLSSVAVPIRAVITGLTLEQAIDRVRVVYYRPDTGKQHKLQQTVWKPPAHCWSPLLQSSSSEETDKQSTSPPSSEYRSLELQTKLEFVASGWTATATMEIGLGLIVPIAEDDSEEVNEKEAIAPFSRVISLLPPGVVGKVKMHPTDTSYTW